MSGKPNLPWDADLRSDLAGMANPTPGLTALDQEREASMADEGGVSGALMEAEGPVSTDADAVEWNALRGVGIVMACGFGLAMAGWALRP